MTQNKVIECYIASQAQHYMDSEHILKGKIHDGQWNFLQWTYKKNVVKAIVLLYEKINNQKKSRYSLTSWRLSKIFCKGRIQLSDIQWILCQNNSQIQVIVFIDDKQFELLIIGELSLQMPQFQNKLENLFPFKRIQFNINDGKEEYAISKFVDNSPGPWNLLIRVSTNPPDKFDNLAAPEIEHLEFGKGKDIIISALIIVIR
ncbi:hypothetical protein pb186bvf_019045 [Paramecium bursaria]